ncbi:hypothetical protein N9018_02705 [Rhodopirellula sp.]|nr:hypothetical protein [Rhodopirellula sp.]
MAIRMFKIIVVGESEVSLHSLDQMSQNGKICPPQREQIGGHREKENKIGRSWPSQQNNIFRSVSDIPPKQPYAAPTNQTTPITEPDTWQYIRSHKYLHFADSPPAGLKHKNPTDRNKPSPLLKQH